MFGAGAGIAVLTAILGRALHTGVITTPELGPRPRSAPGRRPSPNAAQRVFGSRCDLPVCRPGELDGGPGVMAGAVVAGSPP
jgi:hypothetical protein